MISLINVTKEYQLGDDVYIAPVKDVTLEIAPGEFILIIGRSGTGKSTLLNLAAGLVRPSRGQVCIGDIDVSQMSDREISRLRGEKIGFVFQFPSLLPSLSVLENVAMPALFGPRRGRGNVRERARDILRVMGLRERADAYPRQLSAGEQKRAVIARALINNPGIILADEPTSDLDEQTEREVMDMIQDIHAHGVTILMVTHNLHLTAYADRVFRMEDSQLKPEKEKLGLVRSLR